MVDTEETVRANEKINNFTDHYDKTTRKKPKHRLPGFLKNIDPPMIFMLVLFSLMTLVMIVAASYLVCCFIYTIIHA